MMTQPPTPEPNDAAEPDPNTPPAGERVVRTDQLFAGQREITIEHEGERYRLRITRRNKLILQK